MMATQIHSSKGIPHYALYAYELECCAVCYHIIIGTVDTPSLQGRIAAQGDTDKVHVFVFVRTYVCVRACAHAYACKHVLVSPHVCMHTRVHAYVHTCILTYCATLKLLL